MGSFRTRLDQPEWLDEGRLSAAEVAANLRDLALINRFMGGAHSVLAHLPRVLPRREPLQVLDIACGAGDVLRALARELRRRGRRLSAVGVDANPHVLAHARTNSSDLPEVHWVRADARRLPFPPRTFDLVVCSTFLHHLSPAEAPAFLRRAASLSRGWLLVADLTRSSSAAAGFALLAPLLRFSPVTRHDGAASLRRAYRPSELRAFATQAGLHHGRVVTHAFSRMALVCGPNGARS
jgi:2-polyprenyl-3-methyl-5-hydroxy-6-metoxy-1,4-benzoquinol methylase